MQRMSNRSVRRINRKLGTKFVRVAVRAHPTHAEGVTEDDKHWWFDRSTGEMQEAIHDWPPGLPKVIHWTSCPTNFGQSFTEGNEEERWEKDLAETVYYDIDR